MSSTFSFKSSFSGSKRKRGDPASRVTLPDVPGGPEGYIRTSLNNNLCDSMAPDVSGRFSTEELPAEYHHLNAATSPKVASTAKENKLKCVFLGDGAVGKTSLVVSYSTNGYPTEYVPTAFDNYSVRVQIDGQPTRLDICDTAGQDEFDSMRPLCYTDVDVFLVCFSVVRPVSLCNIRDKWLLEIKKHKPKVPILLVGTQTDLRDNLDVLVDLARCNQRAVTEEEASKFAKQCGAIGYVECSALTQKNMKEVFDLAIIEAQRHHKHQLKKAGKRTWRLRRKNCSLDREQRQFRTSSMRRVSVVWWKKLFCAL